MTMVDDPNCKQAIADIVDAQLSSISHTSEASSPALTKLTHAYQRDTTKQTPKPGKPESFKKKGSHPAKRQAKSWASLRAAVTKRQPSAEHPCRICGDPTHWANACPRRHNKEFRDRKMHESFRNTTTKLNTLQNQGDTEGFGLHVQVLAIDEQHYAEMQEEDDQHPSDQDASDTEESDDGASETASLRDGEEEVLVGPDSPCPSETDVSDSEGDSNA